MQYNKLKSSVKDMIEYKQAAYWQLKSSTLQAFVKAVEAFIQTFVSY